MASNVSEKGYFGFCEVDIPDNRDVDGSKGKQERGTGKPLPDELEASCCYRYPQGLCSCNKSMKIRDFKQQMLSLAFAARNYRVPIQVDLAAT